MSILINNELFKKAIDLWDDFKEELIYRNRFIVNHEVMGYIKHFAEINKKCIEKDTILYRARMYSEGKYKRFNYNYKGVSLNNLASAIAHNPNFWGYDEIDSFVPPNNDVIAEGRANPSFIKYLYSAEEPYTAMAEIRPYLKSKVSVAEIKVDEQLNIADLSNGAIGGFDEFETFLIFLIEDEFSTPSNYDKKSYIATQFISEYIKTLGYDGIRFSSSLYKRGNNVTIFKYNKCHAIGSKLYEISDICIESKGILPINQKPLIHYKLESPTKVLLKPILSNKK